MLVVLGVPCRVFVSCVGASGVLMDSLAALVWSLDFAHAAVRSDQVET